jgi:hypothetical protein
MLLPSAPPVSPARARRLTLTRDDGTMPPADAAVAEDCGCYGGTERRSRVMPFNPMKTRKDWQKIKQTYGIPDRVIKSGSFGEKSEKLAKKFDSLGLANVTVKNASAGLAFVKEADTLLEEWLTAARKLKPSAFKDQTKALETVKNMKQGVGMIKNLAEAKLNPIGMSKANWEKFDALFRAAQKKQTDGATLQSMYAQGIRNYIGQGFHDAYKLRDTLHFPGGLTAMIVQYEKIAAKWDDLNADYKTLEDDAVRAAFWKDMIEARRLGKQIIETGT